MSCADITYGQEDDMMAVDRERCDKEGHAEDSVQQHPNQRAAVLAHLQPPSPLVVVPSLPVSFSRSLLFFAVLRYC